MFTKKLLSAVLAVLTVICFTSVAGFAFFADDARVIGGTCGDDLTWTLDRVSGELLITGTGDMYDYTFDFPAPWNEYPSEIISVVISEGVTSVGKEAFGGSLIDVKLPDTLKRIGVNAFSATAISEIVLPDSLEYIGMYAFFECMELEKDVYIPENVSYIGHCAFSNCSSLKKITVAEKNEYYRSIDGILYDKDASALICCPAGQNRSSYTLPDSVTSIEDEAFTQCKMIKRVILPDGLQKVGDFAFKASSIESVVIPDGVTELGFAAFEACKSLTSADLGRGITKLKESTFSDNTSLSQLCIRAGLKTIEKSVFVGCGALKNVHYLGSREEWNAVDIDEFWNYNLLNAKFYFHADGDHVWGEWRTVKEA
ncbi:MAG: leucine-rich repeat domain-containing protein, partial [Clostridia bacterium]|nr:leucine-rich repeat domain-containing protein [Clostridia bacterium]